MVNDATARKLREQGFLVRFVSLDLDEYMAWLARKHLHDSSTAREQFAATIADSEMGLKSAVPAPGSEPSGETPKRLAPADMQCDIRKPDRWMRLAKMTIITVAVAVLASFVGGYNLRALKQPVGVALPRSPEIRRAIPVEPEIRKAIPVQTRKPQVDRRSDLMAFISPGRAIARDFATRHANANPLVGKTSRSVIGRKASK